MSDIEFRLRWREELVAVAPEGTLVFECTIAGFHVYFPDAERWRTQAPAWARDHHERYLAACRAWCRDQRIPLTVVPDANVHTEREA